MPTRLQEESFRELVEGCVRAARLGLYGTWYRGVRFAPGARPTRRDMGLPPPERCAAGRFNRKGDCVLYLARTLEAVEAEVDPEPGRPVLFVQRYDVDLPDVRVLERPRRGPLAWAWAQADQRATVEEDYALTHLLADALREARIDAVVYESDESAGDGPQNLALLGAAARRAEGMAVGDPSPFP
ncbi:MAG TPA: RES family NAD+ phosphorylase [Candidatus Thermoplasmatota archaeon]|nr:RES family NAD+ phosphorylase [Candidatus Thermoplasmatota archaeon]